MNYEEIVSKIVESTRIDKSVLEKKIRDKISELGDLVSKEGAAYIIAKELGVSLSQTDHSKDRVSIKNLVSGLKNVSINARVVTKYPVATYEKDGKELHVGSMLVSDGTAYARVVFWNDFIEQFNSIKEGDVIKVINAYVKEDLKHRPELHVNFRTKVRIVEDDGSIPKVEAKKADAYNLSSVKEGDSIRVLAMVVNVFKKNCFFMVCPECGKSVKNEEGIYICKEHGRVVPKKKLFVSYVIDDGHATMRATSFGNDAERILGMTTEEAIKLAESNGNMAYPIEHAKSRVIGKEIILIGQVRLNSFSNELEVISSKVIDRISFDSELSRIAT